MNKTNGHYHGPIARQQAIIRSERRRVRRLLTRVRNLLTEVLKSNGGE